jgi:TolA-binding protein
VPVLVLRLLTGFNLVRILANINVTLCLAATLVGGGVSYLWLQQFSHEDGLSAAAIQATNKLLERNSGVVQDMGNHPDSALIFEELSQLWIDDTDWDGPIVAQKMAVAFRDQPLGLYALQELYDQDVVAGEVDEVTFSESLLSEYPNSRVASIALDHLLKVDESAWLARCNGILARHASNGLHAYAWVRLGDYYAAHDDFRQAQQAWYQAWASEPEYGLRVHNKLFEIWLATDDWFAPSILGTDFLDEAILVPVVKRLLERKPGGFENQLDSVGRSIASGDMRARCDQIRRLLVSWPDMDFSDTERAELALAIFLLGDLPSKSPLPLEEFLPLKNEFSTLRSDFLKLSLASFDSLAPDLRALYTLRISRRLLANIQAKSALDTLEVVWRDEGISTQWRERLLIEMTDILINDLNRAKDAAAAYVEYCETVAAHPAIYRLRAGMLYYRSEEFESAYREFTKLIQASKTDESQAMGQFMLALCHGALGRTDEESSLLEELSENYAETDLAPQALERLSSKAVARFDNASAQFYLEQIRLRYPGWKGATVTQNMEEALISIRKNEQAQSGK